MPNRPETEEADVVFDAPINEATVGDIIDGQFQVASAEIGSRFLRILDAGRGQEYLLSVNINYSVRESNFSTRATNAEVGGRNLDFHLEVRRLPRAVLTQRTNPTLFNTVARSLAFLPTVRLNELPDDAKTCPVCTEPFCMSDRPTVLKCNHIVGRACIEQWILSGHNSCPMCRAMIFEPAR